MKQIKAEQTNSSGIAMGRVFIMKDRPLLCPEHYMVDDEEKKQEISKAEQAIREVSDELEIEKNRISNDKSVGKNATKEILEVHQMLVNDIGFFHSITRKVTEEGKNAQQAVWECCEELCKMFRTNGNSHMTERTNDIYDIRNRILCKLTKEPRNPFLSIQTPVILIADELTPSDICKMNRELILGVITAKGSIFGHVAIMAEDMGIPMLVGVDHVLDTVTSDSYVIMDAATGDVIINPYEQIILQYQEAQGDIIIHPDQQMCMQYQEAQRTYNRSSESIHEQNRVDNKPLVIKDARVLHICANAGSIQEIKSALACGVTEVGLFRTEQLFMTHPHFPTEEEQFEVYREAALLCKDGVSIRTLDIGGDKKLDYYPVERSENFDMQQRGIRISLCMKERFKEQLRAILRAGVYGEVRILLPMIVSQDEIIESKKLIEICKKELEERKVPYRVDCKVGIMIETPEAVSHAKEFAKTVDFFSIGTNDLTQYLLNVKRDSREMLHEYDQGHPIIMAAIEQIMKEANEAGIPVSICGEMAGDPKFTRQLLNLGLNEFSMAFSKIPVIQKVIESITDTSAAV